MNSSYSCRNCVLAFVATACSSVGGSDPSLWKPSDDLGGARYVVPSMDGTSGAGAGSDDTNTPGNAGAGGLDSMPPSTGGTMTASGGATSTAVLGNGGDAATGAGGALSSGEGRTAAGGTSPATGGTSAGGSLSGAGGQLTASSKCTFSFDVTTVTARGRFAPLNVGAIWISDAQGKFVKTLRSWGTIEMRQVTAWVQASGNNKVDAVSGATRHAHGPLNATWNCTDVTEATVADGNYLVHVSFAESDASPFTAPIQASVPFTKSAAGADVTGPDTANFTAMHVELTVP